MSRQPKIRYLQPGEPIPLSEPRRYSSPSGYVRLRWREAPGKYVECWEHRVVAGHITGMQVHHKNHVRDDNRPDNLELVSSGEHGERHQDYDRDEMVRLYAEGLGTGEIAQRLGCDHPSTVYRALVERGVTIRTQDEARRAWMDRGKPGWKPKPQQSHCKHGHPLDGENLLVMPSGRRACRACAKQRMERFKARRAS